MSDSDIKTALPQDRLMAEPFAKDDAALQQLREGKLDHHPLVQAFISQRESAAVDVRAENERLKDMANVGTDLMEALKDYGEHPQIKGWHPADCPTEIVGTLLNALDKQSAENERLRAALRDAREVLAYAAQVPPLHPDNHVVEEIGDLGKRIGFGALMNSASAQWAALLCDTGGEGGEFVCSPCRGTAQAVIANIDATLNGGQSCQST